MFRLLLLLLVLTPLRAQEVIFRQVFDTKTDTHVEVLSLFSNPSLGGYHPVRVVISNQQKIPHKIVLTFKDSTSYDDSLSTSSSYSFLAPPGDIITSDLLIPLSAQNGSLSYHALSVNLTGTMGKSEHTVSSVFEPDQAAVLLSGSLYTANASALDTEFNSRGSSHSSSSSQFSSKFDPKQLPDDWRAFSGFDSVLMTESDWAAVPPGSRNALVSWLRLGGQLVVYSSSSTTSAALGLPEDPSFGQILIKPVLSDLRLPPDETVDLVDTGRNSKTRVQTLMSDFNSGWPIQKSFGEKSFNYVIFVIILVAFGILVGPVNLFVFAKSGRRHRLFITTPIISIGTSLLLVVLIIFQDGFGGEGTRIVLMEVRPDANQNAAFIQQEQFSRTGVMTSPGFSVDAPALVAPVPIAPSRWARFTDSSDSRGIYDLQPAAGKIHASGDWFQSRSEQGQLVTAVLPTRGRIEATTRPGVIVSTFDFPIQTLLYKDTGGKWHRAENVTMGESTQLKEMEATAVLPILNELGSRVSDRNKTFLKQVQDREDYFIAITDAGPALETHPGIDWKTTTIITGPLAR